MYSPLVASRSFNHNTPTSNPIYGVDEAHKQPFVTAESFSEDEKYPKTQSQWQRILLRLPRSSSTLTGVHAELTNDWKPATFRGPVLCSSLVFCAGVIILLEVLSRETSKPENGGGLIFARDVESFPTTSSFIFLYLPIIIAVLYSVVWSWVDLDAKRLEPWFQMSKQDGCSAENSLLLQYPFDFLPFVPFTALRRRHWGVFFSGTIMLIIFWIITPLQPAIFNTGVVTRKFAIEVQDSATFVPLESQITKMNTKILQRAYDMVWLNQSPAPFTTPNFASLPFQPSTFNKNPLLSETWEATTRAYTTNITCKDASPIYKKDCGYSFDNGEGCTWCSGLPSLTRGKEKYLLMYIGWDSDAHVSYSFGNPNCTREAVNNYLAVFATAAAILPDETYGDMQALFCKPTYHVNELSITVNATTGSVLKLAPQSKMLEQPVNEIFNTTLFEYIMGAGVNPETTPITTQRTGDYPDIAHRIEQYPRVEELLIKWPLTNMAGYAAGIHQGPFEELSEPNNLRQLFEKTHQLLFSAALSVLTVQESANMNTFSRQGIRTDEPAAIILVRTISIVVEIAFGLVALLTTLFWLLSVHRVSNMRFDPASVGNIMAMVPSDNSLSNTLNDNGTTSTSDFGQALRRKRYRLRAIPDSVPRIEPIAVPRMLTLNSASSNISNGDYIEMSTVRPLEHRIFFGVLFSGVILIASAALIFLDQWSKKHDGITIPSQNPIIGSILQNYAPTAFATLLEPMWLILSRLLCLLTPFDTLRQGNAKASQSIRLKYTAIPPQLAIWRAFRAKHFLLAAVCFITVSANFLAVTLAGLLNEGLTDNIVSYNTTQSFLPLFNDTSKIMDSNMPIEYRDHFYVAFSHYGSQNALPAWLDESYFFLPFNLEKASSVQTNSSSSIASHFQASTYGITTNPNCSPLVPVTEDPNAENTVEFIVDSAGTKMSFRSSHLQPDGTRQECQAFPGPELMANISYPLGAGAQAMEFLYEMRTANQPSTVGVKETTCTGSMVSGWIRAASETSGGTGRKIDSNFISCHPSIQYARFNVTVDAAGHILSSNRTSDFVTNTKEMLLTSNASFNGMFGLVSNSIASHLDVSNWHNDSLTSDYLNYLLKIKSQSPDQQTLDQNFNFTNIVEPLSPLPNVTAVAQEVGDIYTQLFVILLSLSYKKMMVQSNPPGSVTVQVHTQVTKLFVSEIMYRLSLAILIAHFCTAVAYYIYRPKKFLTRMPTTIASIIAYVSSSRALDDFVPGRGEGDVKRGEDGKEQRYGYGRFIGRDGKTHVGIERMRYVIPLESKNPDAKKTGWLSSLRWRGKGKKAPGDAVKTWI